MRVIAGTARSLPLKTPEGMDTRPTTDRIKETLFNMLQTYIPDCVFVVCKPDFSVSTPELYGKLDTVAAAASASKH